jgi:hypothetical protein
MKRLFLLCACTIGITALLGACSTGTPRLDADYGTSYKLAKFNQILNPDAEKNLEPVYGMNGIAAESAMGKYYLGFEEKKAAPTYTIPIGRIMTAQ